MNRNTTLPSLLTACCALTTFLGACIPPAKDGAKTADTGAEPIPEGNAPGDCVDGEDNDLDGLTDCADKGCTSSADCADPTEDADADGIPADQDCDDGDPTSTTFADDADCDGVLTADDCDDADAASTVRLEDADCDAVLAADDCDDHDPASTVRAEDGDCDRVLAADDCDDGDAASTVRAEDGDCDGVITEDDCDDADATIGLADVDDPDCDGVPTHFGGGDMIRIAAGTYDIGCTPGQSLCPPDDSPVMPVTLTRDFYISETEVNQEQYQAVMGFNPSGFNYYGTALPVDSTNWHMAAAFANTLSDRSGLTQCYTCRGSGASVSCTVAVGHIDCDGYRLPTEAEWEVAARCGTDLLFPGSNVADLVAWYSENSDGHPHPVGELAPNDCGLYDMAGNNWEWVQDWMDPDYYLETGRTDPAGPASGAYPDPPETVYRGLRGGSWVGDELRLFVAHRSSQDPGIGSINHTIRLARTVR